MTTTTTPIDPKAWSRSHQTLTVINVAKDPSAEFKDRIKRLNESLNEDNIKTDILSAADGELRPGIVFEGEHPGGADDAIREISTGYVMVLVASEAKKDDEEL